MINAHAVETEAAFRRFEWERAIIEHARADEATRRPAAKRHFPRLSLGGWVRTQAQVTISVPWFVRQGAPACN
ncbi:MAG: hypothetical protein U0Z70_13265 [Thermomicrobiales bacterium]